MTYREIMEQNHAEKLRELESLARKTGERQTFRTGQFDEQSDGFMEPTDYYEKCIFVYPDGSVTGAWVQIY